MGSNLKIKCFTKMAKGKVPSPSLGGHITSTSVHPCENRLRIRLSLHKFNPLLYLRCCSDLVAPDTHFGLGSACSSDTDSVAAGFSRSCLPLTNSFNLWVCFFLQSSQSPQSFCSPQSSILSRHIMQDSHSD